MSGPLGGIFFDSHCTYQISFKCENLFVDGMTFIHMQEHRDCLFRSTP